LRRPTAPALNNLSKLSKPLSELTKAWTHVPLADIEAFVNRPAETRHREVEQGKRPGYVPRPLNAFMLYRKAYQERTRLWGLQNNHKVVSKICGESWKLEPETVKKQFARWADREARGHKNAHRWYKYSPRKPRQKRQRESNSSASSQVTAATSSVSNSADITQSSTVSGTTIHQVSIVRKRAPTIDLTEDVSLPINIAGETDEGPIITDEELERLELETAEATADWEEYRLKRRKMDAERRLAIAKAGRERRHRREREEGLVRQYD
jgi:hypothetical protein